MTRYVHADNQAGYKDKQNVATTLLDKLDTVTRHTIKAGHMTQQGMVPRQATYGNQAWYQDRLLTVTRQGTKTGY